MGKLLILTIVALTATTSFAQSGPSGPSGPSDDFKACDDNSTPTYPDGTALDLTTKHKPCTDGKPVCADGTIAKPPPRHGPGHKGPSDDFTACDDHSTPTCPDGTPLDLTTKHKPCTYGKPVCADGTIARPPPHHGPGHKGPSGDFKACDDNSTPTCPGHTVRFNNQTQTMHRRQTGMCRWHNSQTTSASWTWSQRSI